MSKIVAILLLATVALNYEINFPGIQIPFEAIVQVRRAHMYLEHQLNLYEQRRTSKYTLFLGCDNYAEILNEIKRYVLNMAMNYIAGNQNVVIGVGNVVIGSNNKLAGNHNWIMTEKDVTSKEVESNVLYIGRWRIKLDKIPIIEYRPEAAIDRIGQIDQDIIRNIKGVKEWSKITHRNLRDERNSKS